MSEVKKKTYVKLWLNEAKSTGLRYLSGKDLEGNRYNVYTDDKIEGQRNLCKRIEGAEGQKTIANLQLRTFEKEGVISEIYVSEGFLVGENMFFTNADGTTHMTRKDGSIVMNKKGEPVENATHSLTIG